MAMRPFVSEQLNHLDGSLDDKGQGSSSRGALGVSRQCSFSPRLTSK